MEYIHVTYINLIYEVGFIFLIPGLTKHIAIIPMTAATTADINIDEYPYYVTSIPVNVGAIIVAELTKKCVIPPYVPVFFGAVSIMTDQ